MNWRSIEIGLVLQGGGALGAYEWGAIEALFDLMDELESPERPISLKAVTGVSIGAINGACVVGATGTTEREKRLDGRKRLATLWEAFKFDTPFPRAIKFQWPGFPDFAPARDASLFGLPGFYRPRTDYLNYLTWTSFYDNSPIEDTLRACVSFDDINDKSTPTTFVVTAVDVNHGILHRFRNKPSRRKPAGGQLHKDNTAPRKQDTVVKFEPAHIMASGSLPPQFPWKRIAHRIYWDGGLVDNTPLGDAIEALSDGDDVCRVVVVMNLYPLTGKQPADLFKVLDRMHELSFGNRARQDSAVANRINALVKAVRALRAEVDAAGKPYPDALAECLNDVQSFDYKVVEIVEIDLQSGGVQDPEDDVSGLRDFSPETVDKRRREGKERARRKLREQLAKEISLIKEPA